MEIGQRSLQAGNGRGQGRSRHGYARQEAEVLVASEAKWHDLRAARPLTAEGEQVTGYPDSRLSRGNWLSRVQGWAWCEKAA